MNLTARIAATFNRSGAARDNVVAAAAMPAVSRGSQGSGAPSSRRLRATLAVLSLALLALVITAAPASAAPPTTEMDTISEVSYTSAHVSGKLTSDGSGEFNGFLAYEFQYSTDQINWSTGFGESLISAGVLNQKKVGGKIEGLKAGTKYFVRLTAHFLNGPADEATSPLPNPSFTTLVADAPSVETTDNASEVAYTTAKVSGKVIRPVKSDDLACNFEYITDEQFTANQGASNPGFEGATPVPCETEPPTTPGVISAPGSNSVHAELTTLANATTYHLRLAVSGAGGKDAKESASTFTTLTVDPPSVVSIENAGEVEYTQAKVKGVVKRPNTSIDPAFDISSCTFEAVTDQQFNENPPGEEFAGAIPVACEGESPIHAEGQTPVKATLTTLLPSTTYHLRLSASNQGGSDAKEAAATFTTAGPVPKPTVISTDDPIEVKFNSAKVSGEVQRPAGEDPALNVECRFEYVTQAQFEAEEFAAAGPNGQIVGCIENPITKDSANGEGKQKVSAGLSGLAPQTTYHLRLAAENIGGVDTKDALNTFITPEADKPVVTIDPVAGGTFTTAHVSGTVEMDDPGYEPGYGSARIEKSTDNASWSVVKEFNGFNGNLVYNPAVDITGLQPSTTYFFRIAAKYGDLTAFDEAIARGEVGFSPEPNPSITTGALFPPTAEDLAVTDITGTSAHFSATVDPHAPAGPLSELGKKAFATTWTIKCIPECKDKNGNPLTGVVQGEEGAQLIGADAKRLEPNTPYEATLTVSSEGGTDTESITFPTLKLPPSVKQTPGASDGKGGYTLQGVVNPNNQTITDCEFKWGPNSNELVFSADCSPLPSAGVKPTTVEAHLTGLNPGAHYHSLLVVKYGTALEADSGEPQEFVPTLAEVEPCPANEQIRAENSSLALPECRAYEKVTPSGKEGFPAELADYSGGDQVEYASTAGNIAQSGQNQALGNIYVATRTAAGWETIANLNGSSGTLAGAPSYITSSGLYVDAYSGDLLSSLWQATRIGDPAPGPGSNLNMYLRKPDGTFTLIGPNGGVAQRQMSSANLSHFILWGDAGGNILRWGQGVYEYVGIPVNEPRRVDVDNSGNPITACVTPKQGPSGFNALGKFISSDGRVIVVSVAGHCGGANPPAEELWARVGGTTSVDVSASQCDRTAADPGGACNAPVGDGACSNGVGGEAGPGCRYTYFQGAASDGSRIFFTTKRQLVNADTDEANDLYACDIPSGTPAPVDKANPCASLTEVSGAASGADVMAGPTSIDDLPSGDVTVSDDGSTAYFTAKGVLADNEDALGEKAVIGDDNLYVWRIDASHPDGQTTFLARLDTSKDPFGIKAQATPDGRYLVFTTASQLVDTDTDNARDVYRYDADTNQLTRASVNVLGAGGNGPFDASIGAATRLHPTTSISDDGKVIFTTAEPLNLAVDNNDEPDVYLWTPSRVSLISTGSVGGGTGNNVAISESGQDIYFETAQALTPADGEDILDVYDARIGGGFSFAPKPVCSGEECQPDPIPPSPNPSSPANTPNGEGNVRPSKPCPKGKVRNKKGKCVKKSSKKHSGKKHHSKKHKRANSNSGGGK